MLGLMLAAAGVVGPPAPATVDRRRTIAMRWDAAGKSCVASVAGVDLGDVGTDQGRNALALADGDKGASLHVSGGADVPYLCMADMVDALREIGHYGPVGFVAGPAPGR